MKKVSIVLPTYNGEAYIEEAIQSVLKQTYLNIELIVVDDCSTDKTAEIVQRCMRRDDRIRLIHNAENQKLPRSLNIGFRQATGDYFTWTSDDNYYDEDAIEVMLSFLEKSPQYAMVYCDIRDLYDDGMILKSGRVKPVKALYSGSNFGACFLYRRQAAEETGEYDPDMFLAEDYDYLLRFAKRFASCYLPVCKYTYRIHQGSLSQTRTRQVWRQLWRLRRRELDYLLANIDEEEKQFLFLDMWLIRKMETWKLRERFFPEGRLPRQLRWVEQRMTMDAYLKEGEPIILFGAGEHGQRALRYFGQERVHYFADNNPRLMGTYRNGVPIISFEQLKEVHDAYQLVLSVGNRFLSEIIAQLEAAGIREYVLFLEMWMKD